MRAQISVKEKTGRFVKTMKRQLMIGLTVRISLVAIVNYLV